MTDILRADEQRKLHQDHQHRLARIDEKLEMLVEQNRLQSQALRIALSASATSDIIEAAVRHQNDSKVVMRYVDQVAKAEGRVKALVMSIFFAGVLAVFLVGLSLTGIVDAIKSIVRS